ncbi:hypothetical protein SCZ71_04785 [Legionella pneumophila serogroup 1]|nr:hypothetical protein [Legionella jordanis]HAU0771086.1 hypothetical protein [Legionella pneumophila]
MSIWKQNRQKFAQRLLNEIKAISFIKDGKLHWYGGFDASPYDLLAECITPLCIVNYTIDTDLHQIIKDVIKKLILSNQDINEATFVKEFHLSKIKPKYFSTKKFQVVVEAFLIIPEVHEYIINESKIRVLKKKFPRKYFLTKISHELMDTIFYVTCHGRNSSVAIDKALSSIKLLRAIWYLSSPPKFMIEGLQSQIKPTNPVEIRNYCYFLEENKSEPYKKQIENFLKDPDSQTLSELDNHTLMKSKKLIRLLNKIKLLNLKYYELLTNSMLQYFNALDSMDRTNSLPLLWGALETLGKKNDDGRYDELIKRCGFLFKDTDDKINILEIIKNLRNDFVHNGADNTNLRKLFMINLEQIYRQLFIFHVHQALNERSFEDALEFLSLPSNNGTLKEKKKLIDQAIRFRINMINV